ncbi:hypothetical protein JVT61DRAFT_2957 [Boletus reticuloceps]|uniref:Uncharacterized protein n=1 Tax=Boletus reticuloceps TaxID=495285 RepID=A0A8I2YNI9_9AGAM|nr:hypothetical protein JVT61DRAFT_2957 [Boletus reticuloceps]
MDRKAASPPRVASGSGDPALGSDPNPSFAPRAVAAPPATSSVEVPQAENLGNAPILTFTCSFLKGIRGRLTGKGFPGSSLKLESVTTPPSFDLLKGGVPKQTMSTYIPAWTSLVFKDTATVDLEELNVQSVSHHKRVVQEYQHEFAVVEVSTRGGGALHLAVERGMINTKQGRLDRRSSKVEGRADDRLSILSEPDAKDHVKAPLVRTLRWDRCKGPPLLEVMQLLCLVSADFPKYLAKTTNCYHFVSVSCLAMQVYRGIHQSPSTEGGAAVSKSSHFAGMEVISAGGIKRDAYDTALAFFHVQMGWRNMV